MRSRITAYPVCQLLVRREEIRRHERLLIFTEARLRLLLNQQLVVMEEELHVSPLPDCCNRVSRCHANNMVVQITHPHDVVELFVERKAATA
jgi:hypothetical protein